MKLEQSFEVAAPLERVWAALIDVEHVAPCLPGASVTGRNDDGSYNGSFKVKIGPTSAAYTGKLLMEDIDESAHTATMNASGTDKRGQGGAKALIVSKVSPGFGRRHQGRGGHRLPHHRPAGPLRPRRDDRGDLQPPAGPVRRQPSGVAAVRPGGTAPRRPAPAETADHGVRPPRPRRPPAATAAGRSPATAEPPLAAEPAPAAPPPPRADAPAPAGARPRARHRPPPVESEPVEGLSLMASVMAKQIKSNPAPVLASGDRLPGRAAGPAPPRLTTPPRSATRARGVPGSSKLAAGRAATMPVGLIDRACRSSERGSRRSRPSRPRRATDTGRARTATGCGTRPACGSST